MLYAIFATVIVFQVETPSVESIKAKALPIARQHIDKILRSPATAQYGITKVESKTDGEYRIFGTVDAQNGFGALVRAEWGMVAELHDGELVPEKVIYSNRSDKPSIIYESAKAQLKREAEEKEKLAQADAQTKEELEQRDLALRNAWKEYAAAVGKVEAATDRMAANSPKRLAVYWKPIHEEAKRIREEIHLGAPDFRKLVDNALENEWPTEKPSDAKAVRKMLKMVDSETVQERATAKWTKNEMAGFSGR